MIRYKHANTDWMDGNFGISIHWTAQSVPLHGAPKTYEQAVADFDVPSFVKTLKEINAKHLIFITSHGKPNLPMPNPVLDMFLPGLTTSRDLLGELAEALEKAEIDLIVYYNHCCARKNIEWKRRIGYAEGNLDLFAARICMIVEYIARRYGKRIKGWWFDSCYELDDSCPTEKRVSTDLNGWRFPWEALTEAAKTGNPNAAVAYNSGENRNHLYTSHQDYSAGEITDLSSLPAGPYDSFTQGDLHTHRWFCADLKRWVHNVPETPFAHPRFEDKELEAFLNSYLERGAMMTLNVEIDQDGILNPETLAQIRRLDLCTAASKV